MTGTMYNTRHYVQYWEGRGGVGGIDRSKRKGNSIEQLRRGNQEGREFKSSASLFLS